ncbi:DUF2057 family protein [Ferrimonas lipolytica]|uniref:DUF2057 domain-containing protein n=1 Tax=Ferrimonas lipolytica TaxID=2724191 RepID=A0A6H1UHU9_9GAMM|nr:DUF2057 family protein [Ferrimonas lipolytica]QIZ78614.1 DUF2057 domain-containing protein [Ferrimonas lipolytica]
MRTKTLLATAATALLLSTGVSAAQLQLGDGFFATAVNGNEVSVTADSHKLTSGKQVVTVRYEENIIHSSERNDYTVTGPMYVVFDANDSANYQIVKNGDKFQLTSSSGSVNAKIYNGEQAVHNSLSM